MPARRLVLFALAASLGWTACSGPRETAPPPPIPDTDEQETPDHPAYETFDPASYDAEPDPLDPAIQHDVPPVLMEGTVTIPDTEGPRTVQGYRIQVFSSADKAAAEDVRDEATGWWNVVRDDPDATEALPNGLPIEVDYNRPYYRVRLGAFEYRREAEAALRIVQRRFDNVFIVPDVVTIGE